MQGENEMKEKIEIRLFILTVIVAFITAFYGLVDWTVYSWVPFLVVMGCDYIKDKNKNTVAGGVLLTITFLAVFITYFTSHPNKFITNKVIVIVTVIVIIIYMICSCFFEDNK